MSQATKTYDANFEDWYKRMFNKTFNKNSDSLTKTDTMSDEDYEVGTNLYQAYLQKNNLLDQYNKANTNLDQERMQSQQQASIQLDKLKKYIPTQIKAQGLGGLGVSESTLLKANSDYQNTMGQIASDIGARQLDLLQSYNSGVSDIDQNLTTSNQNTLNKYQEIYRQEREQQKAIIDNHFRNEMLLDPEYLTEDGSKLTEDGKAKIQAYLDNNKDVLGELYETMVSELNNRPVYTNEEKEADTEKTKQEELDQKIIEGKEYIKANGHEYKITSQLNAESNEIKNNDSFRKQLKERFGTSNPYSSTIPNGTTFEINCDAYGADVVDWKDFVGWLLGPTNIAINHSVYKKNVTYYNGQWYLSEKK